MKEELQNTLIPSINWSRMFLSLIALAIMIDLNEVLSSTQTVQSVRAVIVADLGASYSKASSPKACPSLIVLLKESSFVSEF